ncbi:YihY/virulence factor BrkB family protein [Leucobacter weissii]|uniref:YihY/virulence factor BrkB family protein n=1 Tax=Leucobacter weissii TaxID=1983706 RepID=A0A939MHX1_9MICO|nr:YihY/virulence factor BrkB family protein [Leucobacter weissii]MBO1900901.1 YihY/virulence factor BrkB family protein [Leucobacter weissii]
MSGAEAGETEFGADEDPGRAREPGNAGTGEPGQPGGIAGLVRSVVAFALRRRLVRAYLLYSEHRGPGLADSITYRALFSVFAALLLGFSLAALWLGGNPEAMRTLTETLDRVIPGLTEIVDPSRIDAPASFTVVGAISLIGLLGAAISAIASLRIAIRVLADELHDDGFFLWVLLRNLLVAIGFGGLLAVAAVLSVLGSQGLGTVASWTGASLSGGVLEVLTRIVGVLIVFAVDTIALAMVFRLLSGVSAPARALWGGAALGGVGLTVLQELSGLFVRGAASNPLLASFAALIALLLWFNLSAQVILLASSYTIVATAESHDRVRERYGASTLAQHRRRRAEDLVHAATRELRAAQEAERAEREAADTGRSEASDSRRSQ